MARVVTIHQLDLKPGVDAAAFEKFITETLAPLYHHYEPRQSASLVKGDRGERTGQYALLIEIDSVEARDEMYPAPGELSPALQSAMVATASIWEEFKAFLADPDPLYTDYVVMA